jgi:hypothetical protein
VALIPFYCNDEEVGQLGASFWALAKTPFLHPRTQQMLKDLQAATR